MNWIVQVGTYDLFKSQVHAENQNKKQIYQRTKNAMLKKKCHCNVEKYHVLMRHTS